MKSTTKKREISPIFILGRPRSGTTWLANIVSRSREVASIQNERYNGILESGLYSFINKIFLRIKNENIYTLFLEIYSKSNYFLLSNLSKEQLIQKKPKNISIFFRKLMITYAKNHNANFWLEKTPDHIFYVEKIKENFPTAKLIFIKRNTIDTIKSSLRKTGKPQKKIVLLIRLLKETLWNVLSSKLIEIQIKKSPTKILKINFRELVGNYDLSVRKIYNFVGLVIQNNAFIQKYEKNTHFKNNQERKLILSEIEIKFVNLIDIILRLVPSYFYKIMNLVIKKIRKLNPDMRAEYNEIYLNFKKEMNMLKC